MRGPVVRVLGLHAIAPASNPVLTSGLNFFPVVRIQLFVSRAAVRHPCKTTDHPDFLFFSLLMQLDIMDRGNKGPTNVES